MPRLVALLVLAGVGASMLPRRRPAPVQAERPAYRLPTEDEIALLLMPSPSKVLH